MALPRNATRRGSAADSQSIMGRTRYKIYDKEVAHFLTATTVNWLPLFSNPNHAQVILDALRHLVEQQRWTLYAYVVMEHHLHWIASAPDLVSEVRGFKSFTARTIIDTLKERNAQWTLQQLAYHRSTQRKKQRYQVWQEGSYPKEIQGGAMLRQKIDYIHHNPVRRGYVDEPTHWRYSSARDYAGEPGLIPVTLAL